MTRCGRAAVPCTYPGGSLLQRGIVQRWPGVTSKGVRKAPHPGVGFQGGDFSVVVCLKRLVQRRPAVLDVCSSGGFRRSPSGSGPELRRERRTDGAAWVRRRSVVSTCGVFALLPVSRRNNGHARIAVSGKTSSLTVRFTRTVTRLPQEVQRTLVFSCRDNGGERKEHVFLVVMRSPGICSLHDRPVRRTAASVRHTHTPGVYSSCNGESVPLGHLVLATG